MKLLSLLLPVVLTVMWARATAAAGKEVPPCNNAKQACKVCLAMDKQYDSKAASPLSMADCNDAKCTTAELATALGEKVIAACPTLEVVAPQYRANDPVLPDNPLVVIVNIVISFGIFAILTVVAIAKCGKENKQ